MSRPGAGKGGNTGEVPPHAGISSCSGFAERAVFVRVYKDARSTEKHGIPLWLQHTKSRKYVKL